MSKPKLVLSNATSFFFGGIEAAFAKAQKLGFKYVEVLPYRWSNPDQILAWERQYGVEVVGIHLPLWWQQSLRQKLAQSRTLLEKIFVLLWNFYLGNAQTSPGLILAEKLAARRPYLLFHANMLNELVGPSFAHLANQFNVVVENLPYAARSPNFYWNPISLQKEIISRGGNGALVFDIGHFNQNLKNAPAGDLLRAYQETRPAIVHISYNSRGPHLLPNKKEQVELKTLLKIHAPKYITIETNPLVSVRKGKKLFDELLEEIYKA